MFDEVGKFIWSENLLAFQLEHKFGLLIWSLTTALSFIQGNIKFTCYILLEFISIYNFYFICIV